MTMVLSFRQRTGSGSTPRLAGICGSDLSTIDGAASRYFEDFVSFPFVPGHEVVADTADGRRVVLEPVLGHECRGFAPPFDGARPADGNDYRHLTCGHLEPGLQTGFCESTGGGWSTEFVAHPSQLHEVPDWMSDELAVVMEPVAGGVHAALRAGVEDGATVAVIGAGAMGLVTVAALRHLTSPGSIMIGAKYPIQRQLAEEFGADVVCAPNELTRAVRRATGSFMVGDRLSGGADVVIDAVGSQESIEAAIGMCRPRGRVLLLGMPGVVELDLTAVASRDRVDRCVHLRHRGAHRRAPHQQLRLGVRARWQGSVRQAVVGDVSVGPLCGRDCPRSRSWLRGAVSRVRHAQREATLRRVTAATLRRVTRSDGSRSVEPNQGFTSSSRRSGQTTPMAVTETAAPSLDDETTAALTLFNYYVDAYRERTRREKRIKKAERAKDEAAAAVRNAKGAEETAAAEAAYREAQEAFRKIRDGEEPEAQLRRTKPRPRKQRLRKPLPAPADDTPAEEAAPEDAPAMETDRTDDDAEDAAEASDSADAGEEQ